MMIRKLMASSALAALMAAGTIGYAGAQTSPATEQPPAEATTPAPAPETGDATGADSAAMPADPAASTESATAGATGETNPTLTPDEPTLASAFMGRSVFSSEDPEADNIGGVNDLIISEDGSITHAVVGVGGFLGIGEKNVSVPFEELEVIERDGDIRLIYAATREQLEAAEEFDRTAYDPAARAEPATGDLASAPMGGGAPMGGSDPMAGGAPADPAATDLAAAPAEPATDAPADPATDLAAAPAEPAPDAAADTAAGAPAEETTTAEATTPAPETGDATGADSAAMPADSATESATAGATGETNPTLTPDEPTLASAFMGRAVYSSEDPEANNIGELNDLIVSDDGSITHAVVGVGGFLGIGEKGVSVPFEELEVVERDGDIRLIYAATREQLEAAEEFDRTAYDPAARAEPATGDLASAPMGGGAPMGGSDPMAGGAPTDPAATDLAAAPAEPATDAPADPAATDLAAAPAEPAPDAATDTAASAPAEATTTAEATAPADAGASTDTAAAETPAADAGASTDVAASLPGSEAEFVSIGEGQIRASTMLGKEVYGQDEESIGEVADLVLQDDGQTRAAIIDVGGFLGVGEKRVAIPFNEIQTAQEGDDVRLTVAMSREQLEQAPDYIEPDMTADSTDTATAPATDMAAGTDASGAPATDASGAPATDMAAAPADGQPTDPNAPAEVQSDGAGMEYELASQELTADNLIGTAVYSPSEENLGDVGDVVFDQAGSIQAVVIDVGGFLGVGEKPVAVQYDALNVQKGQNGDLRIVVNATQEQLEGAPAFDEAPAQ